jgi:DNA-binding protein HU-beta
MVLFQYARLFYKEELAVNKAELIGAIAEKSEMTKKDSEKALNALLGGIIAALKKGQKVQIIGFGTFEAKKRKAREGINPRTGKPIKIAAATVPSFKAGKALKDAIK